MGHTFFTLLRIISRIIHSPFIGHFYSFQSYFFERKILPLEALGTNSNLVSGLSALGVFFSIKTRRLMLLVPWSSIVLEDRAGKHHYQQCYSSKSANQSAQWPVL